MRFPDPSWLRTAIARSSCGLQSTIFLLLALLLPSAAAAQDTSPDVQPLSPQNVPQDPLRIAINSAVQKGMQEPKQNPAATPATQNAPGNAAATNSPGAAPNAEPSPSAQQNTASAPPNAPASAKTAPNASQPAAAPAGSIPPLINAGIQAMVSSIASLDNAGNKWGGHKDTAVKLIDQALQVCGQTASPDAGGKKSSSTGDTAAMEAAFAQLTTAQNDFKNAKNAWGGRRDQALALITQAVNELQAGIDYAKSHNTY